MDLNISISNQTNYVVITMNGKIDFSYSNYFLKKLNDVLLSGKKNVIMDFSEITFISSTGIGVILEAKNYTEENGGRFIISSLSNTIRQVFELIGVLSSMEVCDNLDDAILRVHPERSVL
ncbi:MAG: STAS domain-containing protein [Spirochaetia bacterium]|nr:STAS domain-containing protein [Spirochaetia bacterium]